MAGTTQKAKRSHRAQAPRTFDDFERLSAGTPRGDISISDLEEDGETNAQIEEGLNRHGFRHNFYVRNF